VLPGGRVPLRLVPVQGPAALQARRAGFLMTSPPALSFLLPSSRLHGFPFAPSAKHQLASGRPRYFARRLRPSVCPIHRPRPLRMPCAKPPAHTQACTVTPQPAPAGHHQRRLSTGPACQAGAFQRKPPARSAPAPRGLGPGQEVWERCKVATARPSLCRRHTLPVGARSRGCDGWNEPAGHAHGGGGGAGGCL
jgi:hypothetical protein